MTLHASYENSPHQKATLYLLKAKHLYTNKSSWSDQSWQVKSFGRLSFLTIVVPHFTALFIVVFICLFFISLCCLFTVTDIIILYCFICVFFSFHIYDFISISLFLLIMCLLLIFLLLPPFHSLLSRRLTVPSLLVFLALLATSTRTLLPQVTESALK